MNNPLPPRLANILLADSLEFVPVANSDSLIFSYLHRAGTTAEETTQRGVYVSLDESATRGARMIRIDPTSDKSKRIRCEARLVRDARAIGLTLHLTTELSARGSW